MKTQTAKRQEAVRKAWENERALLEQDKGTRQWTPDEQRAIKEGKTPKDENGYAYEGHHMKSVNKYPRHADNPSDIQFLTKAEHLDAHKGNFKNQTNGYYNPDTGETASFGNRLPSAPEAQSLSSHGQSQGQGQSQGGASKSAGGAEPSGGTGQSQSSGHSK